MALGVFINFSGNCREALEFYSDVFGSKIEEFMSYSDAPAAEGYVTPEADKDKVMYAHINIGGSNVMFSDAPEGLPHVIGNNVILNVDVADRAEVERLFNALNTDPNPPMPPQQTFFADYYAMAADKFGLIWNIMKN